MHEVCVLLRCKKANGCYCIVARAFIVLMLMTYAGIPL